MSITIEKIQKQRFLILALLAVVAINVIANSISIDAAVFAGSFVYVPVAGSLVFVSVLLLKQLGTFGKHGTAWISLFGFAIMWFVAEITWIIEETFLGIEPFPSTADIFYLLGYPFLLLFLISYLEPVRRAITKKMLLTPIIVSIFILVLSIYFSFDPETEIDNLEYSIIVSYPIADAFIIVPSLIGISLFFRGKVNFMWTLVCMGIISVFIADTAFMFAQIDDWYYTGHPMEILFHWTYVLMAFGAYDQIRIFKKERN